MTEDDERYEFEVWLGRYCCASGRSSNRKHMEQQGEHYAKMYAREGPVELRMYERLPLEAARAEKPAAPAEPVGKRLTIEEFGRTDGRSPYLWWGNVPPGWLLYATPPAGQAPQAASQEPAAIVLSEAAHMLTAYAELTRMTGKYAEMHYIPSVEFVIKELRNLSDAAMKATK